MVRPRLRSAEHDLLVHHSQVPHLPRVELTSRLADEDSDFAARLEAEYVREENEVFCGLFVKNLENVQGDERDVMIFSVGYGKDAQGTLTLNFGPLNGEDGARRLNVAITRAREQVKLVSSILPAELEASRGLSKGVQLLRAYMEYCTGRGGRRVGALYGTAAPGAEAQLAAAKGDFDTEKRRTVVKDLQRYLADQQYTLRWPGGATGFDLAWPALKNYRVFRPGSQQANFIATTTWWLDDTQPPLRRA